MPPPLVDPAVIGSDSPEFVEKCAGRNLTARNEHEVWLLNVLAHNILALFWISKKGQEYYGQEYVDPRGLDSI
jgi:hypothetical protein